MKILVTGHFDPCGVAVRQRKYLRELGVDFRIAVERVYWESGLEADWWLEHPGGCDTQELQAFAEDADLVVHCPVIHQWWSCDEGEAPRRPEEDSFPVRLKARKTAYLFHGAVNLAENLEAYRDLYRGKPRIATTLDYVESLDADYVPSIVEATLRPAAPLRENGLKVVHAPSDPRVCWTIEFGELCSSLGIRPNLIMQLPHEECLRRKAENHMGFDHLRGSFSVNSLENAGLGLVNLVAVKPAHRDWLRDSWGLTLPWPHIEDAEGLRLTLLRFRDSINLTREVQAFARQWSVDKWSPRKTAERCLEVYEQIARS